jgi:DNA adenine methylase
MLLVAQRDAYVSFRFASWENYDLSGWCLMQYQGGKSRLALKIADAIGQVGVYYEPFIGGLSVASRVQAETYILSDANEALITLYKAWCEGWRPERIDAVEYARLKDAKDMSDPNTAFAGFGLSFGGKWFGGWARQSGHDFFDGCINSISKKMARLDGKDVTFIHSDYQDLSIPACSTVYCDPPYANTIDYKAVSSFDSDAFWDWAKSQRSRVLVSEYVAPEGWESILDMEHGMRLRKDGPHETRVERLFTWKP